ncbi:D-alanyl-D-alanine carboxypeptidase family protein [Daeguia caeni]|uniref:serine-type D-Ala-D-Ala carboxypeptidase n=1 Tax=Daeguia caeni TaxID=439612 RepID=A0ABV9H6A7_9HYPH
MRRARQIACVIFGLLCGLYPAASFSAPENQADVTIAPQVLLIDGGSGTILLSKDADKPIPPASLAKLMTAEVVFDALKRGEISQDTPYVVSEHAWRTGGAPSGTSTMFAKIKSSPTVADLLQGMIVQSANDGAIVLAEGLAGSESAFAERMNERARALGLTGSHFVNATGLPAEGQVVTLHDMVKLAKHIQSSYPEYYHYYAQPEFTWNKITQRNRNPLLPLKVGADGLGTGYTEASGYALVGSAEQNGRRLFLGLSGLASSKDRAEEARKLIQWGMNNFDRVRLFRAGEVVGSAEVFGGTQAHVDLSVPDDVELLLPKRGRERLKARILYQGPIAAPVKAGAQLAEIQFELNGSVLKKLPVFAAKNVETGTLSQRAFGAVKELSTGWLRKFF